MIQSQSFIFQGMLETVPYHGRFKLQTSLFYSVMIISNYLDNQTLTHQYCYKPTKCKSLSLISSRNLINPRAPQAHLRLLEHKVSSLQIAFAAFQYLITHFFCSLFVLCIPFLFLQDIPQSFNSLLTPKVPHPVIIMHMNSVTLSHTLSQILGL